MEDDECRRREYEEENVDEENEIFCFKGGFEVPRSGSSDPGHHHGRV
jgi:hypothetical protein